MVGLLWVSFCGHRVLIPSVFLFRVCARLWGLLLLSYYILPLPHHLWGSSVHHFPSTGRGPPCRGSCFPFLFIVTPSGVPCRSSVWFLIFLSSLLAFMASSSSVTSLPSSAGFSHPLVGRLGVPPSRHPWIHLLVRGWSSSMALLIHSLLPPPLHLAISGSFSISLGLPPLLQCCGSLSCPLLWLSCRSPCLHALLLLGVFLLFAWATGGLVQCSLLSLCRVASTFLFPVCNPSSYGLHPDISMSAFPGHCLFRSSALLFLSFCMGAWSTCLVSLPCVSLLGFHSSLFFRLSLHVLL